ncbi:MAG: arginase [Candidatus Eiseniibacteriota bacterium]
MSTVPSVLASKRIRLVGAPMDLGAGRRGVDMGPSALRVAELGSRLRALGYTVEDFGDVRVKLPEQQEHGDSKLKYKAPILETCRELSIAVEQSLDDGCLPVVLGGDHSVAIGSTSGLGAYLRKRDETMGLIWFDAHGDMNTPETTPSGNIHGMALAIAVGLGDRDMTEIAGFKPKVHPKNAVLVGPRSIDLGEKRNIEQVGVHVFTMRQIDERGMRAVMEEALAIALNGTGGLHVSFDMDCIDPSFAPGTGTTVPGGITYREAHLAMEMVSDSSRLMAFDLMEVNPVLDEHNQTANLAVELLLSALGKRIL